VYINRLHIQNLRSLERVEIEFNIPGGTGMLYPNVNVMLGSNGRGKTSVLRAVALSALGPLLSSSSGYVPDSLVRRPPSPRAIGRAAADKLKPAKMTAELSLDAMDLRGVRSKADFTNLSLTTTVEPLGGREKLDWKCVPSRAAKEIEIQLFDDRTTAFFMVAYGATRRVEASVRVDESARVKSRLRRYERVSSLFEDHLGLIPLSYWLPAYAEKNKGRYAQVLHLLDELLPSNCVINRSATETEHGREHLFSMNGVPLPFRALSDGYRAYIGWIGDMLFHVCMGVGSGQKLRELSGVVLVDEIDLHLHPDWQRTVLPTLAKALHNVQFIVTTHSPLVVGSLEGANLFVLEEEDGATYVKRLPERVHGRSAEQILLSPYFGLESTRAPAAASKLSKLANKAATGDSAASMEYLELLSSGLSPSSPKQPGRRAVREEATSSAPSRALSSKKDIEVEQALSKIAGTAKSAPRRSPPK